MQKRFPSHLPSLLDPHPPRHTSSAQPLPERPPAAQPERIFSKINQTLSIFPNSQTAPQNEIWNSIVPAETQLPKPPPTELFCMPSDPPNLPSRRERDPSDSDSSKLSTPPRRPSISDSDSSAFVVDDMMLERVMGRAPPIATPAPQPHSPPECAARLSSPASPTASHPFSPPTDSSAETATPEASSEQPTDEACTGDGGSATQTAEKRVAARRAPETQLHVTSLETSGLVQIGGLSEGEDISDDDDTDWAPRAKRGRSQKRAPFVKRGPGTSTEYSTGKTKHTRKSRATDDSEQSVRASPHYAIAYVPPYKVALVNAAAITNYRSALTLERDLSAHSSNANEATNTSTCLRTSAGEHLAGAYQLRTSTPLIALCKVTIYTTRTDLRVECPECGQRLTSIRAFQDHFETLHGTHCFMIYICPRHSLLHDLYLSLMSGWILLFTFCSFLP